jgi:hypothetical protein
MKENTFQPELSDFAFILGAICVGKTVFLGKKHYADRNTLGLQGSGKKNVLGLGLLHRMCTTVDAVG